MHEKVLKTFKQGLINSRVQKSQLSHCMLKSTLHFTPSSLYTQHPSLIAACENSNCIKDKVFHHVRSFLALSALHSSLLCVWFFNCDEKLAKTLYKVCSEKNLCMFALCLSADDADVEQEHCEKLKSWIFNALSREKQKKLQIRYFFRFTEKRWKKGFSALSFTSSLQIS